MKWRRRVAGLVVAVIGFGTHAAKIAAQGNNAQHQGAPPTGQSSTGSNSPNITAGGSVTINPPAPTPDKPVPTVYFGCQPIFLPIHIAAASSIHLVRLLPMILKGNPNMLGVGVFETVSSLGDQAKDWPADGSEGRWMTTDEWKKELEDKRLPIPLAAKCDITSYGTPLEDTVISMVATTSDGKQHTYPVVFDPLLPNQTFSFYLVNVCSAGVFPTVITWGVAATASILAEKQRYQFPLKFEHTSFPSTVAEIGGGAVPVSVEWDAGMPRMVGRRPV